MNEVTSDRWLSVDEIAEYNGFKRDMDYKWIEHEINIETQGGSLWNFGHDEVDSLIRGRCASGHSEQPVRKSKLE